MKKIIDCKNCSFLKTELEKANTEMNRLLMAETIGVKRSLNEILILAKRNLDLLHENEELKNSKGRHEKINY